MKYIERWSEDMSFIIGYFKVEEEYELKEGTEALCSKEDYKRNAERFEQKKLSRESYNNNKVHSHLLLKERNKATEQIVKTITQNHILKTTKSDEKPEMWVYKEGIYVPEGKSLIKQICRQVLGEAHTTQLTNEVIAKIEADTYIDPKKFFNEQNNYPYMIPVKNGVLNLKTKELSLHNPKIPYFNKVNADYKPGADCPNIKKFLKEILATKEDYEVVKEMIGYCLVRKYKYENAFMLYGARGRNGKSKLLELITRFVGIENVSGVSLQDIEKDDFALSGFQNKLVNISGDISKEALKDTGKFKALTGRDTISANRKFKERIDFVNYAKIIFGANELPKVYTATDAFWLRWVIIEFPNQYLPQKEINSIPLEERNHVFLQDQEIIEKITSEEEYEGLLNFALEGLEQLEEKNQFSNTQTARELAKDWKRKSNSVEAFIEDCIKESFDDYIPKALFVKEYQAYCKKHRINVESDKTITNTLKESLGITESQLRVDNGRVRVWNRIKFI